MDPAHDVPAVVRLTRMEETLQRHEALMAGWPDAPLADAFLRGLADHVKDLLIASDRPSSLDGIVELAIQADSDMDSRDLVAVLWIIRVCVNVVLSNVLDMSCTQEEDRTIYTVLDGPAGAGCSYSYTNATKHKIAHEADASALVLNNSLGCLITSGCISKMFYEAICNKGEYYSANCTVLCTNFPHNKGTSPIWPAVYTVLALVAVVVVVVAVVVAVVVLKKCKKLQPNYAQGRPDDVEMVPDPE